jgi:mannose-6-phosphate isomerase-like protein (cupin superfamily)
MPKRYIHKKLKDVRPVKCPCGSSRRILTGADNALVSIHRVKISRAAKKHFHKRLTEFYIVIAGSGAIELNDSRIKLARGDIVMIPPLTRHAARGKMEIINVVCPPFDPKDEYVVE